MTDEKKKDKKENEGVKDAKKIDDEQLKDVAGGDAHITFDGGGRVDFSVRGVDTPRKGTSVPKTSGNEAGTG